MAALKTKDNISAALRTLRGMHQKLKDLVTAWGKEQHDGAKAFTNKVAHSNVGMDTAAWNKLVEDTRKGFYNWKDLRKKVRFEELDAMTAEVDGLKAKAEREINVGMGRPAAPDTSAALLNEMREGAAWSRIKGYLDSVSSDDLATATLASVRESLLAGDEDAAEALRRELPLYLKSRGQDAAMPLVEQEFGKSNPAVAVGLAARAEMEAGVYQLRAAINHVRYAIEKDQTEVTLMLWEKGQTERLPIEVVRI